MEEAGIGMEYYWYYKIEAKSPSKDSTSKDLRTTNLNFCYVNQHGFIK